MKTTQKQCAIPCVIVLILSLGILFAPEGAAVFPDYDGLNAAGGPNLIPYKVTAQGWTDKIPVSKKWGVTTDDSPLYATDTLYVAWSVINDSDVAFVGTFDCYFYVDDTLEDITSVTDLGANEYYYVRYHSIGKLSAGTHTLKIVVDANGVIDESNEGDNEYTRTIAVLNFTPGKTTLVSPSGKIDTAKPAYIWNANPDATWYYLWVQDSTGTKIQQWYKAADAGCPAGTGTCTVTPQTALAAGAAKWWIQGYNANGYGLWSDPMDFSLLVPGKATLIAPSGNIKTTTPAYTWNADPDSTWYYLWVDDSKGTRILQWLKAADVGCPEGKGTCSVTPQTALAGGPAKWWIQTYNANGNGPWSDAMSFSVGLPGKATLVSPSGKIDTTKPAYTWNADPDSTWYYLWVEDSKGPKIKQWVKAADAGCGGGTGTCTVAPGTALAAGSAKWWIQTYNANGYGPWSDAMDFSMALPGKVTLVAPSGNITVHIPSFSWISDADATWYYLWVDDSTGTKIKKWYKAADAGCPDAWQTCSVSPGETLAQGAGKWWVQTYNANGDGPWSDPKDFFIGTGYDGTWTQTGSLKIERANHTATLIKYGRVLVAGGRGFSNVPLVCSDLYDPDTGKWSETGNLNFEHENHTATLLPDGKVLVAGGQGINGVAMSTSELYDPDTGKWTLTGNLNVERYHHTATLLPDGKVLVAGGEDSSAILAASELYDPKTGKWTRTGDLNNARFAHTETLLLNGKVLVAAGYGGELGVPLASSELYLPSTGRWILTGSLIEERNWHTATLLPNGKVLVAGGAFDPPESCELYDPDTGGWTKTGNLSAYRALHTATLLKTGEVLVAGGAPKNYQTCELYNPSKGTWTLTGDLNFGRYRHRAVLLEDGRVLAVGGIGEGGLKLFTAELYEP